MTLFAAIETGDLSVLQQALQRNPDLDELGPERITPLIAAAGRGSLPMVEALLAAGAEPEWRDATGETAMLKAAANGHLEVARLLAKTASADDRQLASSFLNAFGASHAPEFQYSGDGLHRKAVEVAARAAHFVGHDEPLDRLERVERSEKKRR